MGNKTKPIIVSIEGITISIANPDGSPEVIEAILKGVAHQLLGSNLGDYGWRAFAESQLIALRSTGLLTD